MLRATALNIELRPFDSVVKRPLCVHDRAKGGLQGMHVKVLEACVPRIEKVMEREKEEEVDYARGKQWVSIAYPNHFIHGEGE